MSLLERLANRRHAISLYSLSAFLGGCELSGRSFNADVAVSAPATETPRYLYVASGSCYAGGATVAAGSGLISKYELSTGRLVGVIADFGRTSTTDLPVDMQDYDEDYLAVLVENTTTTTYRRIDLVPKDGAHYPSTLTYGAGTFSAILRSFALLDDGSTLISRSAAVAKLNPSFGVSNSSFINAPSGLCATSTTLVSDVLELPQTGKILFAHAGASPNNRIGLMSADGATCLAGVAGPITTALPTELLLHSSGKVLAAFGSSTAASNLIYSYVVDETANTLTGYQSYSNSTFVNGPSRMAEDTVTGDVYVANGVSSLNNIEKFTYNPNTMALTRALNYPFIQFSSSTRCVSGLVIGE
jgi:hypothetical protein